MILHPDSAVAKAPKPIAAISGFWFLVIGAELFWMLDKGGASAWVYVPLSAIAITMFSLLSLSLLQIAFSSRGK